ncbi:hypothetical protein JCM10213v2_003690 [Rhodosporidiobolus nylandii]
MSFLALPPELKLKILEMVDAQDKAYRARWGDYPRDRSYGHGVQALSVLSKEMRELTAPLLFSPLDLGRVRRCHLTTCLESDALSSSRALRLSLCTAEAANRVVVDLDRHDHAQLMLSLAGPYPSGPEADFEAYWDRCEEVETTELWEIAGDVAPGFRKRLAQIPDWKFCGNDAVTWFFIARLGIQETAQTLQLGQGWGNLLSHPSYAPPIPVADFKALRSLTLIDEQSHHLLITPDVPAIAERWLNWPQPLPPLSFLDLDIRHVDTSVLTFIAQFSNTLQSLRLTGASSPTAQPTTANLPEFPCFTRLSLLSLSLPTIHDHTAVLQALEPYLTALVSLTCTSTAFATSADSAASPFPALFASPSFPSLRHLRLDTAGEASQSSSWASSLVSSVRSTLSARRLPALLELGWSPVCVNMEDPVAELEGVTKLLHWALRRVEGAAKMEDRREMKLLLEGAKRLGDVRRFLEE